MYEPLSLHILLTSLLFQNFYDLPFIKGVRRVTDFPKVTEVIMDRAC